MCIFEASHNDVKNCITKFSIQAHHYRSNDDPWTWIADLATQFPTSLSFEPLC